LDRFAIDAVRVAPGFGGESNPGAVRLLEEVRRRGVPVLPIADGDGWELPGARFAIWHPPKENDARSTDNARSVVLDIEAGGRHVLLTGDLEADGLVRLVRRECSPIDAFLAPHHGGRTANPDWLYAWAKPGLVIASQRPPTVGGRDALAAIEAGGTPLLRTWQRGAIRLQWTDQRIKARGFLDERPNTGASIFGFGPERSRLLFAAIVPSWSGGLVALLGFGLGLIGFAVMAIADWGAWALVTPGRKLDAAGSDCEAGESITARAEDGTRLHATWMPAERSTQRAVLLVHGFAEAPGAFHGRAAFLNAHGWNVARLDLRGYGRSEGDRASFGGREAGDLRAWLDVVALRLGPEATLAVWGRSMGAAVAARAAAEDARIAALVLESPYVDLNRVIADRLRKARVPLPRLFARLIAARARALAGVSLTRPRPLDVAPRVAAPTLMIHGTNDTLVPAADARRLAEAFPTRATLVEVPGARHSDVFEIGGAELLAQIGVFLDASTANPSGPAPTVGGEAAEGP
jgi:competence protein ComEC